MARLSRWRDNTVQLRRMCRWGLVSLVAEDKRLGPNLATPEKAKIAKVRKIQTNSAGKKRSMAKRRQSDPILLQNRYYVYKRICSKFVFKTVLISRKVNFNITYFHFQISRAQPS